MKKNTPRIHKYIDLDHSFTIPLTRLVILKVRPVRLVSSETF